MTLVEPQRDLVRAVGAEVVDVGEEDRAGPEWLSADYVIRKR